VEDRPAPDAHPAARKLFASLNPKRIPSRSDPCFTVSPLELDKQAPLMIKGSFRLSAKEIRLADRVFHIRRDISFSGAVWMER
jgi:hypothetical protein